MASVVNVNITGTDELSANITRAEQNIRGSARLSTRNRVRLPGHFSVLKGQLPGLAFPCAILARRSVLSRHR